MNKQIKTHIEKYPDEIREMFASLRQLVFDSIAADLEETMWAKLPSYYNGNRVVRLIPFKDHINVEASAVIQYNGNLENYKITPKGMLQIFVKQDIPSEILRQIFAETLGGEKENTL